MPRPDAAYILVTLHAIPARAEAMEQRLKEIREATTLEERLSAWRAVAQLPVVRRAA